MTGEEHPHVPPPHPRAGTLALDPAELADWGERFGRVARPPLVVALRGELGAGKTTLVQAICRGYGVTEDVTSPTYALVHQYRAERSPVWHLDLYRLESPAELARIGWDDILAERALVLVEWPERAGSLFPRDAAHLTLEHDAGDPGRRLLYAGGRA